MISSLVFPRREYGGNTPLGVPAAIQVKSVVNNELEIWGCYKVVTEPRLIDLKARRKDKENNIS